MKENEKSLFEIWKEFTLKDWIKLIVLISFIVGWISLFSYFFIFEKNPSLAIGILFGVIFLLGVIAHSYRR